MSVLIGYSTAQEAENVELVKQLSPAWRTARDVLVEEDYLYFTSSELGVAIFNITNPENPQFISHRYISNSKFNKLKKRGDYIYLPGRQWLRVIDVSDVESPALHSSLDVTGDFRIDLNEIAIVDTLAYLAASSHGLVVINISDPEHPRRISSYSRPDWDSQNLLIRDNLAFVANGELGVQIIDISDTYHMQGVGEIDSLQNSTNLDIIGDHLLVSVYQRLHVIDISDHENPEHISFFSASDTINDISVNGEYAFIVTDSLICLDLRDIDHPIETDSYYVRNPYCVIIRDSIAYLSHEYGYHLVDISDPEQLLGVSHYNSNGYNYDIASNSEIIAVAKGSDGISFIRVDDNGIPTVISRSLTRFMTGVFVGDDYVFGGGSHIYIFDVTDPFNPEFVHSHPRRSDNLISHEDYLYCCRGSLVIYDISDITHPRYTDNIDIPARDLFIKDDYLYVISRRWFSVLDISDPPEAEENVLTFLLDYENMSDVYIYETYACITYDQGMAIIDISDIEEPQEISLIEVERAKSVFVAEGIAYIAFKEHPNPGSGFRVFDISSPDEPIEVGYYHTNEYRTEAYSITVSDGLIYLAQGKRVSAFRFMPNEVDVKPQIPVQYSLSPAYPNPFNSSTTLSYTLPTASNALIRIYDVRGHFVSTLTSGLQTVGLHEVVWNSVGNPSGIYFVRLETDDYAETSKVMLMK